jgi:hypothetical protein
MFIVKLAGLFPKLAELFYVPAGKQFRDLATLQDQQLKMARQSDEFCSCMSLIPPGTDSCWKLINKMAAEHHNSQKSGLGFTPQLCSLCFANFLQW